MTYLNKLIEVAVPFEATNRECRGKNPFGTGHPSALHLWWARRPLAACRAFIFPSFVVYGAW
jgi:putative DNA methylase